jgi:hypothetical protein
MCVAVALTRNRGDGGALMDSVEAKQSPVTRGGQMTLAREGKPSLSGSRVRISRTRKSKGGIGGLCVEIEKEMEEGVGSSATFVWRRRGGGGGSYVDKGTDMADAAAGRAPTA